ncbi:deleted in malignant brain tumors 1 protein-like [Mauremys mutica]|uniref:deleted in malignant brain tumors 1 protein-like n=1 Tax=Mauremys mutica TaxID=74926 RepID=UPI001D15EA29|nr:deleted in malignant brain tumors 1 protein-like [Mauremys mutica]
MNMGFPGCLLLPAGHPLGRSSSACTEAGNTKIPILLAWLWASVTGFSMAGSAIPDPAPLRLVNGPNRCTGRVEVLHNQQWGTVCDDSWDLHDATVVCRQLGCGTALSAPGEAWFGQGSDNIWLDETNCTGTEAALSECRARPWGDNTCNHVEDAGVKCSGPADADTAPIRLVNGPSRCAGRVEVLYNQHWGSICDDSWDLYDARVVCRQLGCGMPLSAPVGARFGQGSNAVWLDDVHCIGTEAALSECNIRPWGDHNCNHTQDASVVCSDVQELQLVNGPNRCAGRVEVLHNHQWGTVCDHDWDLQDAGVVCRQLGCGTVLSAPGGAQFGRGSDPIWLDDLHCTGTEAALSECRARPWADNNCNHGEDAGVVCSGPVIPDRAQLRLVNGPNHCAGRVEVLHNQQWGTVCDDSWDLQDAGVVCRQLGCGTALSAPGGALFEQGSDPIWLDEVSCTGTEVTLFRCRAQPWGDNNCHHGEDAGVVCSDSALPDVALIQLVNGSSRCDGRVEVLHNQQWGTVCQDSWDLQNAGVVCRQLGCGTALSAPGEARFGEGSGPIWLDNVHCTGTETALSDCRARPWGDHKCSHKEDAGVVCSEATRLRLVNGPNRCAGRVEVLHYHQWGTVCDGGWDLQDAGVVCRQLGCGTALSAQGGAHFGRGSDPIWLDEITCTGMEVALTECRARPWADNKCTHGKDAGVVCSDSAFPSKALIRLVNGPNHCAGRVEVLHNQQWGTVCDHSWDLQDAGVVCRQLGCGTVLSAPGGAQFGKGSDHIWLDDVHCTGTEAALTECRARPWGDNNCNHGEDAGVVCSGDVQLEELLTKGTLSPATGASAPISRNRAPLRTRQGDVPAGGADHAL